MNPSNIVPYSDYMLIEPVEKTQVLVSDTGSLQTFGKVVAIGKEVSETKVGDHVAFELWDLKDFSINDKKNYFVKESEVICKLTLQEEGMAA